MKLYLLLALLLLAVLAGIWLKYRKTHDTHQLLKYAAAIAAVLFFSYAGRYIFIHKPVFIVHLALLLLSWMGLFFYLFKDRLILWWLLAPLATTLFFIVEAIFFREHG